MSIHIRVATEGFDFVILIEDDEDMEIAAAAIREATRRAAKAQEGK